MTGSLGRQQGRKTVPAQQPPQRGPRLRLKVQPIFITRILDVCLPAKVGNIYVLWRAKQRDASIVIGPHWPGVVVTMALIFGGSSLNVQVVETKFAEPTQGHMTLLVYLFATLTVLLLLKTATTDPGIVYADSALVKDPAAERLTAAEAGETTLLPSSLSSSSTSTPTPATAASSAEPAEIAFAEDVLFCSHCDIYVPDRLNSRHCPDCDVCIEGMVRVMRPVQCRARNSHTLARLSARPPHR